MILYGILAGGFWGINAVLKKVEKKRKMRHETKAILFRLLCMSDQVFFPISLNFDLSLSGFYLIVKAKQEKGRMRKTSSEMLGDRL